MSERPPLSMDHPETSTMTRNSTSIVRFFLVTLAFLGLTACDVSEPLENVDLILDVPDAPVEMDEASGTVPVRPGETSATNSTVPNETDIKEVRELRTIRLDPSFFSFESAAASASGGPAGSAAGTSSGTITVAVFFNGVPIPGLPVEVTIDDDGVTDVTPSSISLAEASVDAPALTELLDDLPAEEKPSLEAWEGMSVPDIIERINQGLASRDVPISVVLTNDGLDGTFRIQKFEFDAQVSL